MGFTRRSRPQPFDGLVVDGIASLLRGVDTLGLPPELLIADLSLGGWQSHQAAMELAAQLGIPRPEHLATPRGAGSDLVEDWIRDGFPEDRLADILLGSADNVGRWIDGESLGDRGRRRSLALACPILEALKGGRSRTLLILAPRFGLTWEREDVLFVELLQAALGGSRHRLLVVGDPGCVLPDGWLVRWHPAEAGGPRAAPPSLRALVPGLLDDALCRTLPAPPDEPRLPLPGARFLVGPECRASPALTSRLEYDRLGAAVPAFGPLFAYAQYHGNNIHVDPWALCREAMERLEEGGEGIALRLQDRAASCERRPVPRGFLQCIAQGWRIALQRFGELSEVPAPSPALPAILRGALFQTRGWGLVMLGRPQEADPCLREALTLLRAGSEGRREYLYLENIAALNLVNLGHVDEALETEHAIEAAAAALPVPDARLEYVNSINLARLYRRKAQYETADSYYRLAFATTWGIRTDYDLVYANVCRARLEAARGRHLDARLAWLRAALHWAAADVPEALGWRAVMAVLGRKPRDGEDVTEAVPAALVDLLLEGAAGPSREDGSKSGGDGPVFLRPGAPGAFTLRGVVAEPGWSVVCADGDALPAFDGPAFGRLRGVLAAFVRDADGSDPMPRVVMVDHRLGREMATTRAEALDTAVRLSIPRVRYGRVDVDVPEATRRMLERSLLVGASPAVERVRRQGGQAVATYRRYLPPRALADDEAALMDLVGEEASIGDVWARWGSAGSFEEFVLRLRALESRSLIELRLPESACVGEDLISAPHDRAARRT